MGIVKKFKDFFTKDKIESESKEERSSRLNKEVIEKLNSLKDEIDYFFTDFEDMGAKVEIKNIYKNDISYKNGSHVHVPPDGDRTLISKHIGYLEIKIKFPSKNIDDIDINISDNIKRSLIDCKYRLDGIGCGIKHAYYNSSWEKRNWSHPPGPIEKRDIIYMPKVTDTYDDPNGFIVKFYTGNMKDKISKLNNLTITLETKPIILL